MENETAILLNNATSLIQDVFLLAENGCWNEIESPYAKFSELLKELISNRSNFQDEKIVERLAELLSLHKVVSNSVEQEHAKIASDLCDLQRAKRAKEKYEYA